MDGSGLVEKRLLQLLCWSEVGLRLVWDLLWPREVMGEVRIGQTYQLQLVGDLRVGGW